MTKAGKLVVLCEDFIEKHDITCPETIYQTDYVIEDAYRLIHKICEIVGYAESEDDE